MYKEIKDTIYKDKEFHNNPDLKYLSNQGVLLLNTALTTTTNKIGSHYKLWQPFISFLLDHLTFCKQDITYVFLGKKAQEWAESVPNHYFKIFETHPASAAHNRDESWKTDDLFKKINHFVQLNGHYPVEW
jgi:uracil DNA glycosylase